MSTPPARGLSLCDDLIFTSRITGTAKALGLVVGAAREVTGLLRAARHAPPTCVLLDLQHPGLDLVALLAELRSIGPMRVVAYGSHVDAASLHAARVAGCDPVLPRSRFVEELPTALPGWLGTDPYSV
jgi:DNA-binding NarL/FixJ family response regulator